MFLNNISIVIKTMRFSLHDARYTIFSNNLEMCPYQVHSQHCYSGLWSKREGCLYGEELIYWVMECNSAGFLRWRLSQRTYPRPPGPKRKSII